MIKLQLILIGIISIILSSCDYNYETVLYLEHSSFGDTLKLNGQIKSFKQETYLLDEKFGEVVKSGISSKYDSYDCQFDSYGDRISAQYNDRSYRTVRSTYEYSENKLFKKHIYNTLGELELIDIYNYCEKSELVDFKSYNPDGDLEYKTLFELDVIDSSLIVSKTLPNGTLKMRRFHDKNSRVIGEYKYYSNGKLEEGVTNVFSPEGLLKETQYLNTYEEGPKYIFEYDSTNNVKSEKRYDYHQRLDIVSTYTYDDNNNKLSESIYYSNGNLKEKFTYKYDENKNLIEKVKLNSDLSVLSKTVYQYKYDEYGNWVKKTLFSNTKPTTMTVREITYF